MVTFCLILLLVLWPLVRLLFKRLSLRRKLLKAFRESGTEFYPCRFMWWLLHSGSICDFLALSGDKAYVVRMMGVKRRQDAIVFRGGSYTVLHRIAFISNWGFTAVIPDESRPRDIPGCYIPDRFREMIGRRMICRCLLVNPVCIDLFGEKKHGERIPLGCGDTVGDTDILTLYDLDRFIGEIRSGNGQPSYIEDIA